MLQSQHRSWFQYFLTREGSVAGETGKVLTDKIIPVKYLYRLPNKWKRIVCYGVVSVTILFRMIQSSTNPNDIRYDTAKIDQPLRYSCYMQYSPNNKRYHANTTTSPLETSSSITDADTDATCNIHVTKHTRRHQSKWTKRSVNAAFGVTTKIDAHTNLCTKITPQYSTFGRLYSLVVLVTIIQGINGTNVHTHNPSARIYKFVCIYRNI